MPAMITALWTAGCLLATATAAVALAGFSPARAVVQKKIEERFLTLPAPAAYRAHLQRLTRDPHPSGSAANYALADYLGEVMAAAGLRLERHEYDAWMPHHQPRSRVALVTPLRLPLNDQEYILAEAPFSGHPDLTPGWNAYAATGDVTGPVVYVNYGRREDFALLRQLGVALEGRIAIARYGANYRGYKAKYAAAAGAIGLIVYTDPANYGYRGGLVYPEGTQWNESTVQRGSIKTLAYPGDPLTPFVAALPAAEAQVARLDPAAVDLPRIPVTPLPYGSATQILSRLGGDAVPAGWQGGLPFPYRLGGGQEPTVRLQVEQPRQMVRVVNVCGTLEGSHWPQQEIILGSHYDAWTFGAVDPNGGTAMLLTLAEALGELARSNPPRRSITICHWDAEEYGIIGSTEFAEEHRARLADAVAYINADMAVSGPRPGGSSSPTLKQVFVDVLAEVEHPGPTGGSVLARWLALAGTEDGGQEPPIGNLGGGSDHVAFYTHLGIPSLWPGMGGPSLYHSGYDDFTFYERFCDPEFVYGPTVARIDGLLALRLANADLLPYAVGRYAVDLRRHLTDLQELAAQRQVEGDWASLTEAITALGTAATAYDAAAGAFLAADVETDRLAAVNAQLLRLERSFLLETGLQGRPWSRSLYASPDPFSGYASWMLPGLRYEILMGNASSLAPWLVTYTRAVDDLAHRVAALAAVLKG